jgi:hypothetical protein
MFIIIIIIIIMYRLCNWQSGCWIGKLINMDWTELNYKQSGNNLCATNVIKHALRTGLTDFTLRELRLQVAQYYVLTSFWTLR